MRASPSGPFPSRRDLLAAGFSVGSASLAAACTASAARQAVDDETLLDRGYERLHHHLSGEQHFLSNHVPMVCEALLVLGRADAIEGWLDEHLEAPAAESTPGRPVDVDAERWQLALGRPERFLDWCATFRLEVEREPPDDVLARWAPRLVPGLAGVATHGVIRTAHAARALGRRDTPIRRLELATALAYWAAWYEELPWDGTEAPEATVADAFATLEPRRPSVPPPRGNIVAGLRSLNETPSFRPVAGRVDVEDPLATISEITAVFAHVYLRNPEHRIHFTHSVTAPSAARLVAPWLDEEHARLAARFAWQAAAGLYVVYGDPEGHEPGFAPAERDAFVAEAVRRGAAHGVKLTEACLREHAVRPDPVYLSTASDAARALAS